MPRRCQKDGRGAEQNFSLSENRIGRGRNSEDWPDAPDQRAWVGGRQKQRLSDVTDSIRVGVKYRARLTDHGHDGARDHIPVSAQMHWYDRLYIEYLLCAVERSCVEVCIALEGKADEIRDRVLRFLREVLR